MSTAALSLSMRREVFCIATSGFKKRFAQEIVAGMNNEELEHALKMSLGIFGGSCGPDKLSATFQGAGLKIWGGWHIINHCQEKPLFMGKATMAMAREVYGISNSDDSQLRLLFSKVKS